MTITQVSASNALISLVEAMTPRWSGEDGTGLYVRMDLRGCNRFYARCDGRLVPRTEAESEAASRRGETSDDPDGIKYPEEARASSDVHFLIFRPDNYTQVFVLRNGSWNVPKGDQSWKLRANHDSCWKDAFDVLDEVVREMREELCPDGNLDGFYDHVSVANVRLVRMTSDSVPGIETGPSRRKAEILSLVGEG